MGSLSDVHALGTQDSFSWVLLLAIEALQAVVGVCIGPRRGVLLWCSISWMIYISVVVDDQIAQSINAVWAFFGSAWNAAAGRVLWYRF